MDASRVESHAMVPTISHAYLEQMPHARRSRGVHLILPIELTSR